VARSPPGERCSSVSGLAGRRADHCSHSVLVQKEAGERNEGARVCKGADSSAGFDAPRIACDRPSKMDGSQQFGPNKAQVGEENAGLGLRCDMWCSHGPGRTEIGLWASFRFKNFKFLLFSETKISLVS
jgi:hypothetical protein